MENAPPMQEPPAPETAAPEKPAEAAEPGTGPASQPEQSVIPGMEGDAPAPSAPGEVIVDFDKINELMAQRRSAARAEAEKAEQAGTPEKQAEPEKQPAKRRGRPPKEQAAPQADKAEKGPMPRTGRPSKAGKAARGESPAPGALDKVICSQ